MVFKQPRTYSEIKSRRQQRDALIRAAFVLDDCKIESDTSAKLKRLAEQMNNSIQAAEAAQARH
jgi:hypothetical protein